MFDPVTAFFATVLVAMGAMSFYGGIQLGVNINFDEDACNNIRIAFQERIVGQKVATQQIADTICDHLRNKERDKPLVISVHGPPGVGKSFLHSVLADALYMNSSSSKKRFPQSMITEIADQNPEKNVPSWIFRDRCTPVSCPGYRILFGTSYLSDDEEKQFKDLRYNLLNHVRGFPESLLVIEEYDKMNCRSRGLLKELVDHASVENIRWGKSIVILESNTGYLQLINLLNEYYKSSPRTASDGEKAISPERAQKVLKDIIFNKWHNDAEGCGNDRVATLKTLGMIDIFVPFFPLDRNDMKQLFTLLLLLRQQLEVERGTIKKLTWNEEVVNFLSDRVEYEGNFSIEGAKEGRPTMSRHVTRAIHLWNKTTTDEVVKENLKTVENQQIYTTEKDVVHRASIHLRISEDGSQVECIEL